VAPDAGLKCVGAFFSLLDGSLLVADCDFAALDMLAFSGHFVAWTWVFSLGSGRFPWVFETSASCSHFLFFFSEAFF